MLSGLDLASALQSPAPTWFSGCSSGLTTVLNFFSMQLPAEGVYRQSSVELGVLTEVRLTRF